MGHTKSICQMDAMFVLQPVYPSELLTSSGLDMMCQVLPFFQLRSDGKDIDVYGLPHHLHKQDFTPWFDKAGRNASLII